MAEGRFGVPRPFVPDCKLAINHWVVGRPREEEAKKLQDMVRRIEERSAIPTEDVLVNTGDEPGTRNTITVVVVLSKPGSPDKVREWSRAIERQIRKTDGIGSIDMSAVNCGDPQDMVNRVQPPFGSL